ncbi:MAG: porin family protein [Spirochaetaceae bacterium]|nr:porin family protein [Spirochaetaceae bacterium]
MNKKNFLFAAVFFALFAGFGAGAHAQVTISGGFALSKVVDGTIGTGGNIYVDYLLPIGIPLSLGGEAGFDTAKVEVDFGTITEEGRVMAIPFLLRVAYHFDWFPKFDIYLVGKAGGVYGFTDYSDEEPGVGFAFGVDLGVAYYFTQRVGIFAEAGFDDYIITSKAGVRTAGGYGVETETIKTPFYRLATVGLSIKL